MEYISTRNTKNTFSFKDVFLKGVAPDGGLFIPVKIIGDSPGVQQGGKILIRIRKLSVMAYPKNMPSFIEVDISELQLGISIKVEELLNDQFEILNSPLVSVVSVNIPRVKIEIEEEDEEGVEGEEGSEGTESKGDESKGDDSKGDGKSDDTNKDSSDSKE